MPVHLPECCNVVSCPLDSIAVLALASRRVQISAVRAYTSLWSRRPEFNEYLPALGYPKTFNLYLSTQSQSPPAYDRSQARRTHCITITMCDCVFSIHWSGILYREWEPPLVWPPPGM